MKTKAITILTAIAAVATAYAQHSGPPVQMEDEQASLICKVRDDDSNAVANATVELSYYGKKFFFTKPRLQRVKGVTDKDGRFTVTATTWARTMWGKTTRGIYSPPPGVRVKKDGCYDSWSEHVDSFQVSTGKEASITVTMIVPLKKRIKPIAMYAKEAKVSLPEEPGSFGYDLMKGDLVAPLGKGVSSDFVFRITIDPHPKWTNRVDKWVERLFDIGFSNEGDGIQPFFVPIRGNGPQSELVSSQTAPATGYLPSLREADNGWREYYRKTYDHVSDRTWFDEVHYYFRVRSKPDGSALYGKIYGIFRVEHWGSDNTPHVTFTYFLSPDGTRNVEYESRKSFFPFDCQAGAEGIPWKP